MPDPETAAPPILVLCFEGDPGVRLFRDRGLAESSMEAHDLEQWIVYDGEGFRRALSPRADGAVAIGPRIGGSDVDDVIRRLRMYLEEVRPGPSWQTASFDALVEAAEGANRLADAINARRVWKVVTVLSLVALGGIAWFLAGRSGAR